MQQYGFEILYCPWLWNTLYLPTLLWRVAQKPTLLWRVAQKLGQWPLILFSKPSNVVQALGRALITLEFPKFISKTLRQVNSGQIRMTTTKTSSKMVNVLISKTLRQVNSGQIRKNSVPVFDKDFLKNNLFFWIFFEESSDFFTTRMRAHPDSWCSLEQPWALPQGKMVRWPAEDLSWTLT